MSAEDGLILRSETLPASPEEALTRQFYEWELRGRGWQLWEAPVDLEPPFRPFFHYLPSRYFHARDDARITSTWSQMLERVEAWWTGRGREEEVDQDAEDIEIDEPPVEIYTEQDELIEIEIALPATLKITKEVASQLLISLTYCSRPLGFEVIGLPHSIVVQLVCREVDKYPLRQQFAAYFPEAVLSERNHFLHKNWNAAGPHPVIVDFGLAQEFVIPLKAYGGFEIDPLISIAGALTDLEPGELGVLQVLFQPTRHPWAESIFRSVTDARGKPFFDNAPELVGQAKQKISQPLYAAVIRLGAISHSEARAWQIAKAMGGGLTQFGSPVTNQLIPLTNDGYLDADHEEDLLRRQARRNGMLLNSEELVSLVHPPSASVRSVKLKRLSTRTKAAPALALNHGTLLGENEHDGETKRVTVGASERIRHTHVIGASGTGKSTFLLNLILQDIEQDNGLAVLDPHGDLIDQILERIPDSRSEDVILLDPSDEQYPIGFNILSAHSEIEKHLLSSDLVGVFRRLSTSWGDQMTSVLGNAILAFLESDRGGTLADLRRFLVEKEYRQDFLQSVRDPQIEYYWTKEFPMLTGGKSLGPLLTRLDTFLRPKLIRHMVVQKENKLDFGEIMNGGKIFLAKLSQGAIGEKNAFLLGSLLVSKFHQIALSRQEQREAERRPFFLYIDEFHNFITPSMTQILSGARKYRLGLILAHQELRQLGGGASEIASAVLSNPYTRVCFRLGDEDARKLADGFSFFEARDLQNLGTGQAICRLERAEYDFNLRALPLAPVDFSVGRSRAEAVVDLSRRKYAARREEVEAELAKSAATVPADEPLRVRPQSKESHLSEPSESKVEPPTAAPPVSDPPTLEKALKRVREEESPGLPEKAVPKPDKPKAPIVPPPPTPLGRGGPEHQYIQQLIKQWAKGMNWQATVEKPILDGAGSVDVTLEKGKLTIACEISVTTGVDQEIGNVEKCLKAGFNHIAVISTDPRHLNRIKEAVEKRLTADQMAKVRFSAPAELFAFIETLEADSAKREGVTKGVKVKVNFKAMGPGGKENRKQSVSETMMKALRRPKDK